MPRPDFGKSYVKTADGQAVLECRNIAPGLTMQDLTMIFERAKNEAEPGDEFHGNPAKWPNVRGVHAVTEAILKAIYGE